jgi:hypothetical protein
VGRDAAGLRRAQARRAATAEELDRHCKGLLAGYKVPREVRFEEIPKTSTGKIQKFQLRERASSASAIDSDSRRRAARTVARPLGGGRGTPRAGLGPRPT